MTYRIEQFSQGRFFLIGRYSSRTAAVSYMRHLEASGVRNLYLVEGSSR